MTSGMSRLMFWPAHTIEAAVTGTLRTTETLWPDQVMLPAVTAYVNFSATDCPVQTIEPLVTGMTVAMAIPTV
jgi:hypothetical protein